MWKLSAVLAALVIGLAAVGATPAQAQVVVPKAQGDAAIDHMRQATEAAEQVTNILVKVAGNPAYANARDLEELGAGIASMRGEITTARRDIRVITDRLNALPKISGPSDSVELRLVDQVVDDIAIFAVKVDGILGTVEHLGDAIEAGQDARVQQLAVSLVKGSIAVVEAQSLMLRARLPMMPSDSSSFAQVSGLACFYDGFAALQSGSFEIIKRPDAAAAMARAQTCMTEHVSLGRAAIEREEMTDLNDPRLNGIRDGLATVHRAMFTEMEGGADLLARARTALARGDSAEALAAYAEPVTAFEQRYQALVTREIDVVERQGR